MRPRWRSLLFVPANAPQRWARAHTRGADCIIVDLEDSTQADAKAAARPFATDAIRTLTSYGAEVIARINNDRAFLEDDLAAIAVPGLRAVVLPKVEEASELDALDKKLAALETVQGLPRNTFAVLAVIESPRALERLGPIADGPRLIGLALGSEDFSLSLGRRPTPAALDLACSQVAYAASARNLMGVGMACGIGNFTDLEAWRREATRAHAMGLTGAMCIHPAQVAALNTAFAPSEPEIAEARAILAAWDTREGGVVSYNGQMLDQPVVERARRLLKSERA
jgi:citrate lyase subunit beta / citryl-CoA lyase